MNEVEPGIGRLVAGYGHRPPPPPVRRGQVEAGNVVPRGGRGREGEGSPPRQAELDQRRWGAHIRRRLCPCPEHSPLDEDGRGGLVAQPAALLDAAAIASGQGGQLAAAAAGPGRERRAVGEGACRGEGEGEGRSGGGSKQRRSHHSPFRRWRARVPSNSDLVSWGSLNLNRMIE